MHGQVSDNLLTALKRLLASEYSLYTKIWGFHWNLVGTDFAERHALYGEWKDGIGADVDVLAERIRQLNGVAPAGLSEFASLSAIKDTQGALLDEGTTAEILMQDVCKLCEGFYNAIEVAEGECKVTSNILQELAAHVDKIKWFLSAITASKGSVTVAVLAKK